MTLKLFVVNAKTDIPLSIFMIRTLKGMNKFFEKAKATAAFSFNCKKCDEIVTAVLSRDKKTASCEKCGEKLEISPIMIKAMSINNTKTIAPI